MNILFSAGYLYRFPFANNNIEISLADCLAQKGHTCYVCGFSTDLCGEETRESGVVLSRDNPYPIFSRALQKFERYLAQDTTNAPRAALAKRFALRHPFAATMVLLAHKDFFYRKIEAQYGKFVQQYATTHQIDAILSFAYPFPLAHGLADTGCTVPTLYYQFDPHGLHESLPLETKAERIALECAVMTHARYAITTRALLAQYQQHPSYQPLCHKMIALDFPTFCQKQWQEQIAPAFAFEKEYINVLFCGTIDDDFRSPAYFLETCASLFETVPTLRLYFLGSIMSEVLSTFATRYPEHIFLHPVVESDIANATIAQADMLLNIGNSITNMMPSKIFDYFATGKPIINVQKIEHCPANPYFAQYPLQITLNEFANADVTEALAAFLVQHKGTALPYDAVLPLYETATPQYVANELERMIKEL